MAHERLSQQGNRGRGDGSSIALQDSAERLEVALTSAFPALENAADEGKITAAEGGEAPVDDRLLNIVPAPASIDFDDLAAEVSRHRRLLVRAGAVVSVAALVSIAGTFLFHAGLVGVAGLVWYGSMRDQAAHNGGGSDGNSNSSGSGYLVMDDGTGATARTELHASALNPPAGAPAAPASLPPAPPIEQPLPPPAQLAMNPLNGSQPDLGIIGIPSGDSAIGQLKMPLPRSPSLALPQNILVAPDQTARPSDVNTRGGGGTSSTGTGGANGDDDEPISWANPGAGASKGRSKGAGHGYTSGASRSEPSVKDWPWPSFSFKTPPKKNPSYKVTVRADGSIAKVELVESCGESDIDELCRLQILRNWTYFPAYVDGKYIEATTDATITLVEK